MVNISRVPGAAAVPSAKSGSESAKSTGRTPHSGSSGKGTGASSSSGPRGPAPPSTQSVQIAGPVGDDGMHKAAIEGRAQKVEKALQEQAAAVNKQISGESQRVEVARDDRSGRFVMRVVDSDSGQLLRQFPPESVLKVNERLDELSGMLLAVEA